MSNSKWYEKLWIYNFHKECQTWREVRRVYKKNKDEFLKIGLKSDWFGRMYCVINRKPEVVLGSNDDEILLRRELGVFNDFLIKMNIMDILAYELKVLEEEDKDTYEHGYLIIFTPAYRLDKQYLTWYNVLFLTFGWVGVLLLILHFIFHII